MIKNYAQIFKRIIAYLIDNIILFFSFGFFNFLFFGSWFRHIKNFKFFATDWVCLSFVLIYFLYFIIFEALFAQTIGKYIVKIKVVNEKGDKISFYTSFLRNILRLIDGIGFYIIGLLFIIKSKKNQRLGDRMAKSFVIKA